MLQIVAQQASDIAGTGLLRFTRLIRLARIVKVFRLKIMKDLRLMVKGWIAGLRTLVLAFTLLFAVLYVISGFATMALGGQLEVDGELWPHFQTIPASMFTAFRCFTGECVSSRGLEQSLGFCPNALRNPLSFRTSHDRCSRDQVRAGLSNPLCCKLYAGPSLGCCRDCL